jgi:hypothetical protein
VSALSHVRQQSDLIFHRSVYVHQGAELDTHCWSTKSPLSWVSLMRAGK